MRPLPIIQPLRRTDAALAAASMVSAFVPATPAGSASAIPAKARDARVFHATPRLGPFLALAAQLALLLLVFSLFNLERAGFGRFLAVVFGAFLVHYWIPFRFKEPFWVAVSVAGAFWLLGPPVAALLMAIGAAFFLTLRSAMALRWRILLVGAVFTALAYGRATGALAIPSAFYPVFGAIFMFRIIIYVYDLAHSRERARLLPFLSYFFVLPNYYFTFFPVIDFQTMRRSYYQRDIHEIAQQGIRWMTRGAIQLALYRLVVYFNDAYLPDLVTSFHALVSTMVLTYLLYMNVSGQFHLIVGMLHLFGYDLPETNRRYLLARSLTDFWRRVNIYWKDFMVKVVYFPIYFRFRKSGEARAQVAATAAVFVVTWALHLYQSFWLLGKATLSWPDSLFWAILGLLVVGNTLYEMRHKRQRRGAGWRARAIEAAQVLGTFTLICTLWSLWSSPSVNAWVYLMTHWARSHG
jgi:D-alanyl-lipoteichoic acid acyltransferase DltB (MBOAT superfamily)